MDGHIICQHWAGIVSTLFCYHQPSGSVSGQVDNRRQSSFSVVGPRTWNDLPDDVTSAESLSTFRQQQISSFRQFLFLTISWTDWTLLM